MSIFLLAVVSATTALLSVSIYSSSSHLKLAQKGSEQVEKWEVEQLQQAVTLSKANSACIRYHLSHFGSGCKSKQRTAPA